MVHAVIVWPETKVIRTTSNLLCQLMMLIPITLMRFASDEFGPEAEVDFFAAPATDTGSNFSKVKNFALSIFLAVFFFGKKAGVPNSVGYKMSQRLQELQPWVPRKLNWHRHEKGQTANTGET